MVRYDTIRLLFVLSAQNSWHIHQLDVKSAFLNGFVDEEIYVEQLDGVAALGKEDYVYLLRKTLYSLKQAPKAWYETMDKHLTKLGFVRSEISLYVGNMLVIGNQPGLIQSFKDEMNKVFEMTDLGVMKYFLGMEVMQSYYKPMSTPMTTSEKLSKDDGFEKIDEGLYRSLIGSLLYLTTSRPDILFAISVLSRFMYSPSEKHFSAAKRVLRYIKGTVAFGVQFSKFVEGDLKLLGYSNNDWGGCVDDSRSTLGYLFSLGSETTTQSTTEVEYIAAAFAVNQALWLRKILKDLGGTTNHVTATLDNTIMKTEYGGQEKLTVGNGLEFGNGCQYGKSHILPFSISETKTTSPLEAIHSDIWGATLILGSASSTHKGYLCLHQSGRVCISRNVIFNKSEFPYMELFSSLANVSSSQTTHMLLSLSSTVCMATTISVSDVHQPPIMAGRETVKVDNHSQLHDQLEEHVTHSGLTTTTSPQSKQTSQPPIIQPHQQPAPTSE
ncbi:hypothetical protein AAG906_000740 [Vitis piasezkii]